ncbi:MAG: hypothetical protein HYV63_09890 [Candidatus Schekmanbacteria bacterium]|nr:hypothetical protein [Candidatus Schekmanbacteria bacterium]
MTRIMSRRRLWLMSAIMIAQGCVDTTSSAETVLVDKGVKITLGSKEIVYDWELSHCRLEDLPDVVPQFFRNHLGELILVAAGPPKNFISVGSSPANLIRDCTGAMDSEENTDVTVMKPNQWISSTYTTDGATVHALIHDEYHDPFAAACSPGVFSPANPCWYNAISSARSTDGGHTFVQPASPSHLVAPFPFKWDPKPLAPDWPLTYPPAYGYMEPSNIIRHQSDGFYYAMFRRNDIDYGGSKTCIMRTADLSDAASWRAWDGAGFELKMVNPYEEELPDPASQLCAPIAKATIGEMHSNLSYNTYFNEYMLVGADVLPDQDGEVRCGFWFSLSPDLITWEEPRFLLEFFAPFAPCDANSDVPGIGYPRIVDFNAPDPNFEITGQEGWLVYAADGYGDGNQGPYNPDFGGAFDTDVVRRPIRFELVAVGALSAPWAGFLVLSLGPGLIAFSRCSAARSATLATRAERGWLSSQAVPGGDAEASARHGRGDRAPGGWG